MSERTVSGLRQQLLNNQFGLFVFALTELMLSDMSLCIDEIEGRPVPVIESTPYPVITVDRDRVMDPHLLCRLANALDVLLDVKFRRVHADHHQPSILVPLRPRSNVGKGASPIDTGVGPEIDQDDFAAQTSSGQRWRVEPFDRTADRRQLALDR